MKWDNTRKMECIFWKKSNVT